MTHELNNPFGLCGYGISVTEVIVVSNEGLRIR
jgi:hypothetical protein